MWVLGHSMAFIVRTVLNAKSECGYCAMRRAVSPLGELK
jgi:hypothetical protein